MDSNELLTGMANFTEASLDWCNKEAFDATQAVFEMMSTFSSSETFIESIDTPQSEHAHDSRVKLAKALNDIAHANTNVQSILNPLLSTFQFQDAITQHAQGLTKMLQTWIEVRTELIETNGTISTLEFGEKLAAHTVSAEEVDCLKAEIPELPDSTPTEEDDDDDCFLF